MATAGTISTLTKRIRLATISNISNEISLSKLKSFFVEKSPDAIVVPGNFSSSITHLNELSKLLPGVHVCLGQDESSLQLSTLKNHVEKVISSNPPTNNKFCIVNTNMRSKELIPLGSEYTQIHSRAKSWYTILNSTVPYAIVSSSCKSINVALLGFYSNVATDTEETFFSNGVPIDNNYETIFNQRYASLLLLQDDGTDAKSSSSTNSRTSMTKEECDLKIKSILLDSKLDETKRKESIQQIMDEFKMEKAGTNATSGNNEDTNGLKTKGKGKIDFIIPITNQSLQRDHELATNMLQTDQSGSGIGMFNNQSGGLIIRGGRSGEGNGSNIKSKLSESNIDINGSSGTVRIINAVGEEQPTNNDSQAVLIDLDFDIPRSQPSTAKLMNIAIERFNFN